MAGTSHTDSTTVAIKEAPVIGLRTHRGGRGLPTRIARRFAAAMLLALATSATGLAQTTVQNLAEATLEELFNIEITSASRKEQPLIDTPAAVFVITQDDIRRSGLTTLPELFRLVPGMQIAQVNSNNWAISARGFNDIMSNKLLVLIDGRSLYTRQFSGTWWRAQDLMLGDIERIEVIRGPGGSVWGANAVNGVINIITKPAIDTKGAVVHVDRGSYEGTQAAIRYGGSFGNTAYRLFSQWSDFGTSLSPTLTSANDGWNRLTNGARLDWTRASNEVTVEGSFTDGSGRPLWTAFVGPTPRLSAVAPHRDATMEGGAALVRWTHSASDGDVFQLQSFGDMHRRDDGNDILESETMFDADAQYHTEAGSRHDIVVGGGYRKVKTTFDGSFRFSVSPRVSYGAVLNAFGQDDIRLTDRLKLSIGSKLEHDSVVGWGVEPTARVMASVSPHQRVWAAVSRALRTPSVNDLGQVIRFAAFRGANGVPTVVGLLGNPDYQTERLLATEAGYRIEVEPNLSVDVTVFRGDYSGLQSNEPQAPVFMTTPEPHLFVAPRIQNLLDVDTSGVEVVGRWTPARWWSVDASYSGLHVTPRPDAASRDPNALLNDGNAPAHQWNLHSSWTIAPRIEIDGRLFHVGRLRTLNIPAYTRADARVEVKVSRPVSIIVTGQNLLERGHAEFADIRGVRATLIPRSASVRLLWQY